MVCRGLLIACQDLHISFFICQTLGRSSIQKYPSVALNLVKSHLFWWHLIDILVKVQHYVYEPSDGSGATASEERSDISLL